MKEGVKLIPGYSLRVVADSKGGFCARLVSESAPDLHRGLGPGRDQRDETKIGAVLRLARELRNHGDVHDRRIADAIDREVNRGLVTGKSAPRFTVHLHFESRGVKSSFQTLTGLSKSQAQKLAAEQRREPGGVARVVPETS
jgi:hypothetical protein